MLEYASWPRRIGALVLDWIASTLVRLGDLTFEFLPPDEPAG